MNVKSEASGQREDGTRRLRSTQWFDNPDNPGMTALYIERYLNFGLTPGELRSGKPIIGIAQTGSDLVALQPPSSRSGQARARRHHRGGRHSVRISRFIRSRRRASVRPRRSTATSPISASSKS